MINHYNGFKAEKTAGNEPLPAGGYVAKILGAEVKSYSWGDVLNISFDITEGEHTNHFTDRYRSDTRDDKSGRVSSESTSPVRTAPMRRARRQPSII